MTHPAAYLRRSYVDPQSPGDISRQAQRAAVRRLAAADGHNRNLQEYDDWGVSADWAKADKRRAYTRLLSDMEAGQVSAVYAFDVDRLYRDVRDLARLQDAAQRHGVRIVTTAGTLPIGDGDDPAGEGFAYIGAVFARMELAKAKKRSRAAFAARRLRGDDLGRPVWGFRSERQPDGSIRHVPDPDAPVEQVLAAVREAGSMLGACRLLNAQGLPSPLGGAWHPSALTRVVQHHAPNLLPRKAPSGRRTPARAVLSGLLICHCGHVMGPNRGRGQYVCKVGHLAGTATHGKYNLREADLLPWVQAEAARFIPPGKVAAENVANERDALVAKRDRLGLAMVEGMLSPEAAMTKQAEIEAGLAALEERESVREVPQAIDWDAWEAAGRRPAETAAINDVLRRMWRGIVLDVALRPIRAEWRDEAWRLDFTA